MKSDVTLPMKHEIWCKRLNQWNVKSDVNSLTSETWSLVQTSNEPIPVYWFNVTEVCYGRFSDWGLKSDSDGLACETWGPVQSTRLTPASRRQKRVDGLGKNCPCCAGQFDRLGEQSLRAVDELCRTAVIKTICRSLCLCVSYSSVRSHQATSVASFSVASSTTPVVVQDVIDCFHPRAVS